MTDSGIDLGLGPVEVARSLRTQAGPQGWAIGSGAHNWRDRETGVPPQLEGGQAIPKPVNTDVGTMGA
jgi:hypothetical protein